MADITYLRILTKKSKIGFGRYQDLTVGDVLILNPSYIPWVYYCVGNISFCDEILQECHIENRITKPGANEDMFHQYRKSVTSKYSKEERDHYFWLGKKIRKRKARAKLAREITKTSFTKGELQAINHGKWK